MALFLVSWVFGREQIRAEMVADYLGPLLFVWAMVGAVGYVATFLFAVPLSRAFSFFGCLNMSSMVIGGAICGAITLSYLYWGEFSNASHFLSISVLGAISGAVHLAVFTIICERLTQRWTSSSDVGNLPGT